MSLRQTVVFAAAAWFALSAAAEAAVTPEALSGLLSVTRPHGVAGETLRSAGPVERFYRERGYLPVWTGKPNAGALDALRRAIAGAEAHGLSPEDYHQAALGGTADEATVELLATDAYLTYAAHLVGGKLHPMTVEPNWSAPRRSRDYLRHLADAIDSGDIQRSLEALAPDVPSYRTLQAALRVYRKAAEQGDWPRVAEGPTLKSGMRGPRIIALRARLAQTGLLAAAEAPEPDLFDPKVEEAVAAFQRRLGLEPVGVVGPLTLRELNRSAAERVGQVRANLERWRWLAEDLGARHIRVNIADFRLEAWRDGNKVGDHEVIVGRPYRRTPVFSGQISYLVFNPSWDTPQSIARLDKLPAFQADPDSLERLGFDVYDAAGRRLEPANIDWKAYTARDFPLRLRQRPGPLNALGRVKLMFPNPHNVYLHDTPSRELFDRTRRDFSSGCIRVRGVLDLAEWVVSETPGWDRKRIDETVASGKETRVELAASVPVHILYMTVVGEPDGSWRFVPDVYDRDARLIAALDKR